MLPSLWMSRCQWAQLDWTYLWFLTQFAVLTETDCMWFMTYRRTPCYGKFMAGFSDTVSSIENLILQQKKKNWSEITLSYWIKQTDRVRGNNLQLKKGDRSQHPSLQYSAFCKMLQIHNYMTPWVKYCDNIVSFVFFFADNAIEAIDEFAFLEGKP